MSRPVLILAGTAEARALAARLTADPDLAPLAALAGVTERPAPYPCPVRRGGFGGTDGLAGALATLEAEALIDATHPFAATISANALAAAQTAAVPLLVLARPPWTPEPGDAWATYPSLGHALATLPAGARVFLATGRGGAKEAAPFFAARPDLQGLARTIEPPGPLAPNLAAIRGAPGPLAKEIALLRAHRISHLVAKNAGGAQGRSKLDAARHLGLAVALIARPAPPPGAPLPEPSLEALHTALRRRLGLSPSATDAAVRDA
ncbi:MAG: precorrin-6A/cobalt-precorrin-6A reductase [Paracoccaceae bacterium]